MREARAEKDDDMKNVGPTTTEYTANVAEKGAPKAKKAAKGPRRAKAPKGASESRSNKKAEVIALMKRAKCLTLAEIMETTGWLKHAVSGFVPLLGSKGGLTIKSAKNAASERMYRIAK